jgi:hypothetical protein
MSDLAAPVETAPPPTTAVETPLAEPAQTQGNLEATPTPDGEPDPAGTFVPLAAVHAERGKAKELRAQLETLAPYAQQVPQLQQQIQELQQRLQQLTPRAPERPAAPLISDDVADGLARKFELYDTEGKPDRTRARDVAGFFSGLAAAEAQKAVAPIAQLSAQERTQHFRSKASVIKDQNGQAIDPAFLERAFSMVPPEIAAQPEVAGALVYLAAGMERYHGKKAGPAAPEGLPIMTERAGGKPEAGGLSEWEMRMLERTGRAPKEYVASVKTFKPGQDNRLE